MKARSWGRAVAILTALSWTSARGDTEETEARLKLAGVPAELRARIHDAIDRAVRYLSSRQREDGSFHQDRRVPNRNPEGYTAICGLALRHAGTPLGKGCGRRAIDWLIPAGSVGRPAIYKDIYVCGLTSLLLHADRRHPEIAGEIARHVATSIDKRTGWWSYFTRYRGPVERAEWSGSVVQLSTTQFAGLAMWAGSDDGGAKHRRTWRSHAYSLCGFQTPTGSWGYAPILPPTRGYTTGTFMGLANLLLAEAALGPRLAVEEPELAIRIERAKSAGMRALARDAKHVLKELRDGTVGSGRTYGELSRGGSGWGYYTLYALEKACVFAGVEELDGVRWYVEGATSLVEAQRADGAWVPSAGLQDPSNPFDVDITTAFALLFLLRDAESYRATTPRPVDAAKGPITPTDTPDTGAPEPGAEPPEPPAPEDAAPPEGEEPPPPPGGKPDAAPLPPEEPMPLADARARLVVLGRGLADPDASEADLLEALDAVAESLRRVAAAGAADDRRQREEWERDVVRVLARAATIARPRGPSRANALVATNLRAIAVLRGCGAHAAPELRSAFDRHVLDDVECSRSREFYDAALGLLAADGSDASFRWIHEEVVLADPRSEPTVRACAGLAALRAFRNLRGRSRLEAVRGLIRRFHGAENQRRQPGRAGNARSPEVAQDAAQEYWAVVGGEVMETLRHLSRDGGAQAGQGRGPPPRAPPRTVEEFLRWCEDHDDPAGPPWRDAAPR